MNQGTLDYSLSSFQSFNQTLSVLNLTDEVKNNILKSFQETLQYELATVLLKYIPRLEVENLLEQLKTNNSPDTSVLNTHLTQIVNNNKSIGPEVYAVVKRVCKEFSQLLISQMNPKEKKQLAELLINI